MSDELSEKLKYQFQQPELLTMALTHRSKGVNTMNGWNF